MTIFVVDIEAVETRYTAQWKEHLPALLQRTTDEDVIVISGGETPQATTPGAFLNFGGTNVYKSKQLEQIGEMFCNGDVKDGDYFLYTDAWNPTVLQLKYMAELLGVRVRIGGLWHAGSYDPHDFLGRLIGDAKWARHAEISMFHAYDNNFFATEFHIKLFTSTLFKDDNTDVFDKWEESGKIVRSGWPMEYLDASLKPYKGMKKRNLILFPHRIAPEKQVDIFNDLAKQLPEYDFVVCQDTELSKDEYHTLLGEAKLVFSANLQETLGISWYEGVIVDAIPMVPDRLSYSEMAMDCFQYPSSWTSSFKQYLKHRDALVSKIKYYIEDYDRHVRDIQWQKQLLNLKYFSASNIINTIEKV